MRIDSPAQAALPTPLAVQAAADKVVADIRVSFEPMTQADTTLGGHMRYMLRQLGVGTSFNTLA